MVRPHITKGTGPIVRFVTPINAVSARHPGERYLFSEPTNYLLLLVLIEAVATVATATVTVAGSVARTLA